MQMMSCFYGYLILELYHKQFAKGRTYKLLPFGGAYRLEFGYLQQRCFLVKGDFMTDNIKEIPFNRLFAYFLEKTGINKKFRSATYGYRTYDSSWKLFKEKMQIAHHRTVKCFENGEYVEKLEESVYSIVQKSESISVVFLYKKLI